MRCVTVFALLWLVLCGPAAQAAAPDPAFPTQIPLTPKLVENFIASYKPVEALGRKYDAKWADENFSDPGAGIGTRMRQTLEAHGALAEFNGLVGKYGFKGVEDWWSVAFSTLMAYSFGPAGQGAADPAARLKESLAQIERNPHLTPDQKARYAAEMKASLQSYEAMKPPQQNVAVVTPYRATLKALIGDKDE